MKEALKGFSEPLVIRSHASDVKMKFSIVTKKIVADYAINFLTKSIKRLSCSQRQPVSVGVEKYGNGEKLFTISRHKKSQTNKILKRRKQIFPYIIFMT